MTAQCFYHGRDNLDNIATFSIAGTFYDYYLPTSIMLDACEYISRRFPLRGLNYAKRRATRVVRRDAARLPPSPVVS